MDDLFKTGKFAEYCGTTKDTLRHYEDIGLLIPVFISENGYKWYSPVQMVEFLLIDALKNPGCSLGEVKDYLSAPSTEVMKKVLDEKIANIEKQRHELEHSQRILENTLARINTLEKWPREGEYAIEECPEEYYIETEVSFQPGENESIISHVAEHLDYCRKNGYMEELQQIARIGREAFFSDKCETSYYFGSRVSQKIHSNRLHIKPAGKYITWIRQLRFGENDAQEAALQSADEVADDSYLFLEHEKFRDYLSEKGYETTGDLYEKEISFYTGNMAEAFYSELSIHLAP